MRTIPMTTQPRMIRRVIITTREGVMQCPRCSYVLSYSDALLCRVGDTHYCPRCWSRISETEDANGRTDSVAHDPVGASERKTDDDKARRPLP